MGWHPTRRGMPVGHRATIKVYHREEKKKLFHSLSMAKMSRILSYLYFTKSFVRGFQSLIILTFEHFDGHCGVSWVAANVLGRGLHHSAKLSLSDTLLQLQLTAGELPLRVGLKQQ